jgi:Flp pilus assembly protein TadD
MLVMDTRRQELVISLLLVVTVFAVFWHLKYNDFVSFDDYMYITENSHVTSGLTKENIIWAFTTGHASNWHPLTWLSHMLDVELYGLNPTGHHLSNLLFHIANTLLLFLILKRLTGALWRSAFVAALFGLHPLHVESVAWASERKDVLSTFFWMLTMGAYARYVERPRLTLYLLTLLMFVLGLMSKPMLVTLPFVLLMLDYWPLKRLKKSTAFDLFKEKIPFFVFSAASSVVTFVVQKQGGSVAPLDVLPVKMRLANALVSYVRYIGKMFFPEHLAFFYPLPKEFPVWQVLGAGLFLLCVSIVVILSARRFSYLVTGWLWYVVTLLPVIGLIHVGLQAMADRYTYVPLIGLFIAMVWGVSDAAGKWRIRQSVVAVSGIAVLLYLMTFTWLQVGYWKNNITLYRHALDVTEENYMAHSKLATVLLADGRLKEATVHFNEALRIKPDLLEAQYNLGNVLVAEGRFEEAVDSYYRALKIRPGFRMAHIALGKTLARLKRYKEAQAYLARVSGTEPDSEKVQILMGNILLQYGNLDDAIYYYSKALQINPEHFETQNNIGVAFYKQGKFEKAIEHFSKALALRPDSEKARANLRLALDSAGKRQD